MPKSVLLLQMLDLMRDDPGLTIPQMAVRLGRSQRTIYRYLETLMDDLHLPVYSKGGGYHIADRAVASRLDLAPKEVLAVRLALTQGMVRRFGPFANYASTAWGKIEHALTSDSLEALQATVERYSIHTPDFSENKLDPGTLRTLADAVELNKRLIIGYTSQHSGETKSLVVDPYALVFRRHNWYMIAFSRSHNRVIQLKLARIIEASPSGEVFHLPNDFSVDSFYTKSWEMYTDGEEQLVKVKFSSRVAPIIRESKRHKTQELKDTQDGGVVFSVRVAGIEEIGFWILSWGADAEVIEPLELRTSIEQASKQMANIYSKPASLPSGYPIAAEASAGYKTGK